MTVELNELVATLDSYLHGWRREQHETRTYEAPEYRQQQVVWSSGSNQVTYTQTAPGGWMLTARTPGWVLESVTGCSVGEAVGLVRVMLSLEGL